MEVEAPKMARIMSDETKYELAEELGFAHKVRDGDWGNITTREAGMLVREAIRRAESMMVDQRLRSFDPFFADNKDDHFSQSIREK